MIVNQHWKDVLCRAVRASVSLPATLHKFVDEYESMGITGDDTDDDSDPTFDETVKEAVRAARAALRVLTLDD